MGLDLSQSFKLGVTADAIRHGAHQRPEMGAMGKEESVGGVEKGREEHLRCSQAAQSVGFTRDLRTSREARGSPTPGRRPCSR